jgi:hypothetical protein
LRFLENPQFATEQQLFHSRDTDAFGTVTAECMEA